MILLVHNVPQTYTEIDLIHQWLSRSGQQPLNITVQFLFLSEKLQDGNDTIASLFDPIRDHSSHWRRMHLIVPPTYLDRLLGGLDSLLLLEHPAFFPSFNRTWHSSLGFRLGHTPLLARVEIADLFLRHISLDWINLTFMGFTSICFNEIFHILRLAPKLTEAKFLMVNNELGDFPPPTEMCTHQSLRTLHIQPSFSMDLNPLFSKAAFPSLVDFTYDFSTQEGWFPLNGLLLLGLFYQSQCLLTHLTLVNRESGILMHEHDLTLLLQGLQTITHLSLLNFDTKLSLITNHFFRKCAETRRTNTDVFLPYLQVLKYEGWRSFGWKELADLCHSRSTPRIADIDDDSLQRSPLPTPLRFVEFELYLPDVGNVWGYDRIDDDYMPLFTQARKLGTTISIHCNVYESSVGEWEMVDLLRFA